MRQPGTKLGYHYYPDEDHYTQEDLARWLPILSSLEAAWLTVRGSLSKAIPEPFLYGLLEGGIQPIIHIPCPVGEGSLSDLEILFRSYASWGVRHVIVMDRPNLKSSWTPSTWTHAALVERYLDRFIPVLDLMRRNGLIPALPPLEPGGDYWDTAFLEATLEGLLRRGHGSLVESLVITAYAWSFGRQLNWGLGGPSRWIEAQPYSTPEGCQDQRGFRIFDWYEAIASRVCGRPRPILVLAGGARDALSHSEAGRDERVEATLGMVRQLQAEDTASKLQAFCFYLLAASPGSSDDAEAWYSSSAEPRPIAVAIRRMLEAERSTEPSAKPKTLEHYILVPSSESADSTGIWGALQPLLLSRRATVGFSCAEAAFAKRVTLAGSPSEIPETVANWLEGEGCTVDRWEVETPDTFADRSGLFTQAMPALSGDGHE